MGLRRNNGITTEKAHLRGDNKKYRDNFDKIFRKGKKDESVQVDEVAEGERAGHDNDSVDSEEQIS